MNGRAWSIGLLVLRLSGLYMAWAHGHGLFFALVHGEGGKFIAGVKALGFPRPELFAWAAASAEFVGGILIFVGLATRVGALFLALAMFVAAISAHHAVQQFLGAIGLANPSAEVMEKWGSPELAILYLLISVTLMCTGPGRISLDGMIGRRMGRD